MTCLAPASLSLSLSHSLSHSLFQDLSLSRYEEAQSSVALAAADDTAALAVADDKAVLALGTVSLSSGDVSLVLRACAGGRRASAR